MTSAPVASVLRRSIAKACLCTVVAPMRAVALERDEVVVVQRVEVGDRPAGVVEVVDAALGGVAAAADVELVHAAGERVVAVTGASSVG